jgi:hypothetical protein
VIEEAARLAVERDDRLHVFATELEVEHREVLRHPLFADRLRDRDDAALHEPANDHLRDRLAVLRADRSEQLVLEDVVLPFREGAPRLVLHAILAHELMGLDLLVEWVRFDLVDRGYRLVVDDQVHEAIGVEVADADRADAAFAMQLLHRAPRSVHVAVRLVDEKQIEDIEPEALHRAIEGLLRLLVARVFDPQLRRDEDLIARDAAASDRLPDGLLVLVGGRSVDEPVADAEGFFDATLALGEVGDLKDTEADQGHLQPVVQNHMLHDPSSCARGAFVGRHLPTSAASCAGYRSPITLISARAASI